MLKVFATSICAILIVGSLASVDDAPTRTVRRAPSDRNPASRGQCYASGIVEGRTDDVELLPDGCGRVDEVFVTQGEWVDAGQPLLKLDGRSQRAQVNARLANLHLAEAKLARLINGARDAEREEARALLAAKRARLRQARLTWRRIQTLRAQDAVAQQEADDRESLVLTLTAEVDAAQARLQQLEEPAREDELRAARARVAAAQADVELSQIVLDRMVLHAPSRAQVLDIRVEPGEMITANRTEPVIVLADTSQLRVRAFVEELDAPGIRVGARATVTADGLEGRSFAAIVRAVSPRMEAKVVTSNRPDELYDSKVREVLLELQDAAGSAGPIVGLRVDVMIESTSTGS